MVNATQRKRRPVIATPPSIEEELDISTGASTTTKLKNEFRMKEDRVKLFRGLLAVAEKYHRKNQSE